MNVVAIIGAGASVAEALIHRPVHTAEHPPLDTNFFSKAAALDPPLQASFTATCRSLGIPNPFTSPEPRMEEIFGEIYFEVVDSDGQRREIALTGYRTLVRLYGRVLAQTTNWMWDRPLGALGRFLRAVLNTPNLGRLTLITFNHDLLLENALAQLPYRQRWCVDEGYGPINLNPTQTARSFARLPRHSATCDHSIPIQLLKLHGSLNWQVMTRSHDPSYRDLFPTAEATPAIECLTDRVVSITLQRRRGNRLWRLWPQIVPPIYQKLEIVSARFSGLWRHASDALASADRISMVGYSLPVTDVHASNLIRRALRLNAKASALDIVNPDPGIIVKVAEITSLGCIHWYSDLSQYLRALESN